MRHLEDSLQITCTTWFRIQYRSIAYLFFCIPNGGYRNAREAARLKAMGVTAGVSDAILLYPAGGYASLCIEFKTEEGRQQPSQKEWQKDVEENGSKYVICRSFNDFRREITEY